MLQVMLLKTKSYFFSLFRVPSPVYITDVDMQPAPQKRQSGFTLAELSIALVIMGIMAGGVMVGTSLIESAESKAVVSQTTDMARAIDKFQQTYGALPGDMPNAAAFFPGISNGNGNGKIDAGEQLLVWKHLATSGLIRGDYDGITTAPNIGLPESVLGGAAYTISDVPDVGLVFELSSYSGSTGGLAAMSARDALSVDEKFDDGNPARGRIRALDGSNTPAQCISGSDYTTAFGNVKTCRLQILATAAALNESAVQAASVACGTVGATRSSASSCPAGYVGEVLETCSANGSWEVSHFNCSPYNCGGGVFGATRSYACPANYDNGPIEQTCAYGGWVESSNNCTPETGACTNGQVRTLPCSFGQSGYVEQTCSGGAWTNDDQCADVQCGGDSIGDTATIACPVGFTGNITRVCTISGGWENVSNNCVADEGGACDSDSDTTQALTCPDGEVGTLEQTCVDGTPDAWVTTTDTCEAVNCGGMPVGFTRLAEENCADGYVGQVYETCQDDASWALVDSNCTVDNTSDALCTPDTLSLDEITADAVVNQTTTGNQDEPDVIYVGGKYLVVWEDGVLDGSGNAIVGRFVDEETGAPIGNQFMINTTTSSNQRGAEAALLSNGNIVVTMWYYIDSTYKEDVYFQIIDTNGNKVGSETLVNVSRNKDQNAFDVFSLDNGNFVVTWGAEQADSSIDLYARIFDVDGTPVTGEFMVNTSTAGNQPKSISEFESKCLLLATGDFACMWADSDSTNTIGQIFDEDGNKIGGEITVNSRDSHIDAALLPDARVALVRREYINGTDKFDILLDLLNADLSDNDVGHAVNTVVLDNQQRPAVTVVGDTILAVWEDNNGGEYIYAGSFDTDGNVIDAPRQIGTVGGKHERPKVATNGTTALIVWEVNSGTPDGSGAAVMSRLVSSVCTPQLTYTSGLTLWFDAADATTISETGGLVNQWNDKSGAAACTGATDCNATSSGAARPTTGTRTLNGLNVLDFVSGSDNMQVPAFSTPLAQPNTIFFVAQGDITTGEQVLFFSADATLVSLVGGHYRMGAITSPYVDSSVAYTTDPTLYSFVYNTTSSSMYINGDLVGGPSEVQSSNLNQMVFGSLFKFFDGTMAEILVYDGLLSDANRKSVECYLSDKWGLGASGC